MSQTVSGNWYLILCKPRQEARPLENLRKQSYTCYAPTHTVEKVRHIKRVSLDEPLFPGYLFIKLCEFTDSWHPIRSTRGVLRLVTFANQGVHVANSTINSIEVRLNSSAEGKRLFATGDPVTVNNRPFRDLEAIFGSIDGEERAIILLNLMQRQKQIKVPLRALRSIASSMTVTRSPYNRHQRVPTYLSRRGRTIQNFHVFKKSTTNLGALACLKPENRPSLRKVEFYLDKGSEGGPIKVDYSLRAKKHHWEARVPSRLKLAKPANEHTQNRIRNMHNAKTL